MKRVTLFVAVLLSACASNTGIVPTGADTFLVARQAATGLSGLGNLKGEALQEADQYCVSRKMSLHVVGARETQPPYILGNYPRVEVQFKCLRPGESVAEARPPGAVNAAPTRKVGTGTAFAIGDASTALTAFHVIEGASYVEANCQGRVFRANVQRIDPANDLALLRLSEAAAAYLDLAPEGSLAVGQRVFTVGFPVPGILGSEPKYADGAISSLTGIRDAANVLQMTVPIQPGNSGGPVVNEQGQVVAVVTSSAAVQGFLRRTGTLPQNVNWAVRIEYATLLLPKRQSALSVASAKSAVERVQRSVCLVTAVAE